MVDIGVGHLTATRIVIERLTELTAETVKGPETETIESIIIIWEEHQIGGTIIIILDMEVTGTGIDTVGVTIADLVPLLGMGEDSHPEVRISEFCRLEVRRGRCLLYITTFYECVFKSLKKAIMSSWVNLFFVLTALLRLISYHQYN